MEQLSSKARNVAERAGFVATAKVADLGKDTLGPKGHHMTTDHGLKVNNTDDWLKAIDGTHTGPSLLEDQIAREKIHRFDHERIPERVVHARGAGAHGYFKLLEAIPELSYAGILNDTSRITSTFVRFSTVQGSRGSADTVRDVRGFATKFYTPEGNWDLVGNNIPVFFIQDAIKFPDFVHSVKPEPHNEVPQGQTAHNNFWDFVYLQPEATHMYFWAMSDRAIPRSYRMMQGFGVNTYTLINAQGKRHFVKFHWTPELGVHSLAWDEALKICGQDPDFHRKDLNEAIEAGAYPKWRLGVQVIPEDKEHDFEFDILDATKIWPEELVPLRYIGEMCLNKTVEEYFPETEQVAFCTSHIVPGIGFSDDPLLQGRNFSYFDTQITRLGANWEELPINRPICPVLNFQRDGQMRHKITKGTVNYWPNRFEDIPPHPHVDGYIEFPQKVNGIKQRTRSAKFREYRSQAQLFYNSLSPHERQHVLNAFSFELDHCDDPVVYERLTGRLNEVDFELAKQVATNVGGIVPTAPHEPGNHGRKSRNLAQADFMPSKPTIATRKVAILITDGFILSAYLTIVAALKSASAIPVVIGSRRSVVTPEEGEGVKPDHHFEGARSTLFDGILIPPGKAHAESLAKNGRTIHWVREAFGHCKVIGALGDGVSFLQSALHGTPLDFAHQADSDNVVVSYGVVTARKYHFTEAVTDALAIGESERGFLSTFAFQLSKHRCWEREMDGLTAQVAF